VEDPAFLTEKWPWLLPWLLFVAAFIAAVRNLYAAEKDRRALARSETEREKLELELFHLKNTPEARQARREIYDGLLALLQEVLPDAPVSQQHLFRLGNLAHEAEFCFPQNIRKDIWNVGSALNDIYVAQRKMELGHRMLGPANWEELVNREGAARMKIVEVRTNLTETFRQFLAHP
jgi:hypothetical protein